MGPAKKKIERAVTDLKIDVNEEKKEKKKKKKE
jgi:hypothetical protein